MTDVALKEYLEAQIAALRREVSQQRDADWRALDLARENLTLRLESMNEFRSAMSDQARLTIPRAEADIRFAAVGDQFEALKKSYDGEIRSLRETRSEAMGRQQVLTVIISLAVSVIGVVAMRMFH